MLLTTLINLLPLTTLAFASPLPRQANSTESATPGVLKPETYAAIAALYNASPIPGGVLAVTSPEGDEVLPMGMKTKSGVPVDENTYWAIASNSKLITAVTINLLIEQNATLPDGSPFALDSKLVDFMPDFQLWNESASAEISVVDLLTHHTGIPGTNAAVNVSWDAADWVHNLRYIRTNVPPHTVFQYSNINFAIATRVVEVVTGRSLYDVSKELVFDPLGLDAVWNAREAEHKAQGFYRTGLNWTACAIDSAEVLGSDPTAIDLPPSCLATTEAAEFWTTGTGQEWAGGGAALLTGNDMLRWLKAILDPGVLPASVVERVQTPVYFLDEEHEAGVGHGTIFQTYRGHNLSLHDGALPGSHSLFVRAPAEKVGFFIAVNDDTFGATFNQQVQSIIMDDLLGLEPLPAANSTTPSTDTDSATPGNASSTGAEYITPGGVPTAPLPESPRPAPDLSGTYSSPAFSDFTLSPLNLSDQTAVEEAGFPLDYLLTDVSTVLGIDYLATPVWHGRWGQMFANHVFFSSFDGPLINYTGILAYDRVPGEVEIQQVPVNGSQYVGKLTMYGPAVWSEEEGGIGLFGNFWVQSSALPYPEVVETGVNQTAEAFFAKQ